MSVVIKNDEMNAKIARTVTKIIGSDEVFAIKGANIVKALQVTLVMLNTVETTLGGVIAAVP